MDGIAGNADDRFGAGNIILGGDGSDVIEGRGGDDLIDGDKWLNVRISVRQNIDGTGPEIASFDSMRPMVPFMLDGTYNPGQLVIVREILNGNGTTLTDVNFDTAVFTGNSGDYDISTVGGVTTVAHILDGVVGAGIDGTDRLTNIERLRFADETIVLTAGLNAEPEGLLLILDAGTGEVEVAPATGQVLTVSAAEVTDADNPGGVIPGPLTYYWQVDLGTGFQDIVTQTGVGAQLVTGTTFTVTQDLAGLSIRVRGVYEDAHGVLEEVRSFPTSLVLPSIFGTEASELINGTTLGDSIFALGGNDTVNGLAGDDTIDGGAGNDSIIGGAGFDSVIGGDGNDTLIGAGGNDALFGGLGDDTLNGGVGNDAHDGGDGADRLNGGDGLDTLLGGAGNDTLLGVAGNDSSMAVTMPIS
ncbi:Hemolysin, chromosomal [Hydrogenophaga sp. T4]|nr:Hemolysin, chromosomal [Hydrogenophaga sp. T4]